MVAFKRPRNLKDKVMRERLGNSLWNGGSKSCSDARCLLCEQSTNTDKITSPITSSQLQNILPTVKWPLKNLGETGDLRRRIDNHRSAIKIKKQSKSSSGNTSTKLSGQKKENLSNCYLP